MKNRKRIAVLPVIILVIGMVSLLIADDPDGRTPESREQILRELPKGIDWHIPSESSQVVIDNWDYIVHPIYADRYDGIAIFEQEDDGRYGLQTVTYHQKGEIVLCNSLLMGGRSYLFCWLNRADLDYAEVTFTVEGEAPETQRLDTGDSGLELICVEAPDADSYTADVVYYDTAGNAIE